MTAIGLMVEGQDGLTWERWQRLLRAAEDFGFQCLFRSDHFTNPQPPDKESLEAWVSLTYAATATATIEFGTMVSPITFRHPSMLVRTAAAIDDLSAGRLVFGLGTGWQEREHHNYGIPFPEISIRYEMLRDALEITTSLLTNDTPVNYKGKHFSLEDAVLLPRPQRPGGPPILIGGNGPNRTLPLVAEFADEWNGVFIDPATYSARNERLNELIAERMRAPGDVKRSLMNQINFATDDADWERLKSERSLGKEGDIRINGTAAMVVDQIGAYVDAGVERFMLQWIHLDDLDRLEALARQVLPHFHKQKEA